MMMLSSISQTSIALLMLLFAVTFKRSMCCHDRDRSLLLIFKQGVVDPSNRLSSWSTQQDCCQWEGVACDKDSKSRVTGLDLDNCSQNGSESLRGEINLSSLLELEFLTDLDLSYNDFERITTPSINTSVVAYTHLLANLSKLDRLDLSYNIHLHIDSLHWLSRFPALKALDLNGIHLPVETNWVQSLASLHLEELGLRDCNLTSFIPSVDNVNLSSVSYLDLSQNDFRYGLPNWVYNFTKYTSGLHLEQCHLRGPIPDFSACLNLENLDLSNNELKGSIPDWLGQLDILRLNLSKNLLHGSIPPSLGNSSALSILDLSFNHLSGTLPKSLVKTSLSLDLSHNSISGDISDLLLTSVLVFMSYNKFEGRLPCISDGVLALDLAHNSFSGSLSSLLCHNQTDGKHASFLYYLDISNNFLTGGLPDGWSNWPYLSYINLGSNKLFGEVPPTMDSLVSLELLDLHNNSFYGDIPWTFQNCTSLSLINLEGNNFSGSIPKWMHLNITVIKLRSNQLSGNIPPQLCSLSSLIVLDLANNKLSGSIPYCLQNLTGMVSGLPYDALINLGPLGFALKGSMIEAPIKLKIDLYTKGQVLAYQQNLVLSIDLSINKLSGEIPTQLFKLYKLQSLNLSHNYLIGEMREQIGDMKDLESLDLSHNNLQGNIPQSMSTLSFLSDLNLSYNYFSGQIPLGTQLQSFDAWSYTGNPELCGAPLQKNCTLQGILDNSKQVERNDDDTFLKSLYLGIGVGFAVGFWVVCGALFLNRAWRHTYFRFFDGVVDRIYVVVAIKLQRFR